eukprot:1770055-Ditylum_brightwellii.AAC.1
MSSHHHHQSLRAVVLHPSFIWFYHPHLQGIFSRGTVKAPCHKSTAASKSVVITLYGGETYEDNK